MPRSLPIRRRPRRLPFDAALFVLACALALPAAAADLSGQWLPQASPSRESAPGPAPRAQPGARGEAGPGQRGPGGGRPPSGGPPGEGGPGGPGGRNGPPRGAPQSEAPAQRPADAAWVATLAPLHDALLLEVTDAAVAIGTAGGDGVLFVPFAPEQAERDGIRLQARRQGARIIVDVAEADGRHAEVNYLGERADGGALLVVARTLTTDGTADKLLFERRYERAPAP